MPILFADDTNLFCTNDKLDTLVNDIHGELFEVFTWVLPPRTNVDNSYLELDILPVRKIFVYIISISM